MVGCKLKSRAAKVFSPSVLNILKDLTQLSLIPLQESTQGVQRRTESKEMPGELATNSNGVVANIGNNIPPDLIDSTDSDEDKNTGPGGSPVKSAPAVCPVSHEGRMLLKEVVPMEPNDLFMLLFDQHEFSRNLTDSLKYTDVCSSNWEVNPETGLKMRVVTLIVPVHQPVGPKTCKVTETQVMHGSSRPGELYVIEVEAVNSGVPYCDSFYIINHYCIARSSATESTLTIYSHLKYRKSVWGFVKGFIEKNVWSGLEEFFQALRKALLEECAREEPLADGEAQVQKVESVKLTTPLPRTEPEAVRNTPPSSVLSSTNDVTLWIIMGVLTALLFLNGILYYKLSVLEEYDRDSRVAYAIDSQLLSREKSHEQWVALLRSQAVQHHKEVQQWKTAMKSIVSLLKQAEDSITSLHSNIQSAVNERVLEALNPLSSLDDEAAASNKHIEL